MEIEVKAGCVDPTPGMYEAWSPDHYEMCGGTHHGETPEKAVEEIREYVENRYPAVEIQVIR